MLDQDIKIFRIMEDRKYDELGNLTYLLRVEFKVGQHGPFVERFPKETYTPEQRDQVLNQFAAGVRTQ